MYPIRCETNTCTNDLDKCSSKTKRCPEGYVLCYNGECKTSEYLCEAFECPQNKPYKCKEGVCVHDKSLCDNEENGCPYNKPYKCIDGACVSDASSCNNDYNCTNSNYQLCPDGSCVKKDEECPLKNGCYKDRPLKCADGTCVNPLTTSCSPVLCPFTAPYKCPNGYCVEKSSDCSNELFPNDLTDCGNGLIMCADGRCVESTEYCRPVFECENSYKKCLDGTCRVSTDLCPKNIKCPASRPYQCENICVKSSTECKAGLICPDGYFKCNVDGLCVSNSEKCKKEPNTDNICSSVTKKMCKNGRCVNSKFDCSLVSEACPDEDMPYLCPNGECTNDITKCTDMIVTVDRPFVAGTWNTVCLPFVPTSAQADELFGSGYQLAEYKGVSGTTLEFTTTDTFKAGVPYLVKPTDGCATAAVTFNDVDITARTPQTVTHGNYSFVGNFTQKTFSSEECNSSLFVATGNELMKPNNNSTLKSLRCYFTVPSGSIATARRFTIDDEEGETTGINAVHGEGFMVNGYYNLNGQRVAKPTKGLFIVNGKKVVIK